MTTDHDRVRDGIVRAVTHAEATRLVAAYYEPENGFAADTFDTLGFSQPYRIAADDLLAVTLLDISFQPAAVRAWLGPQADAISDLLHRIGPDRDLYADDTEEALRPAEELWGLLRQQHHVDWVKAGKLMARKRPGLIPIYDSIVRSWMGAPGQFWIPLRDILREEGVVDRIEALRPSGCNASTLRLLDVAIWMLGSNSTRARKVRDAQ